MSVACGDMTPPTMQKPPADTKMPDPTGDAIDPGRLTLHRLNRVEYNNTVRDLLGSTLRPADDFPADDRGLGFDNIADVLSLSPLQLELYQQAAEAMLDEVMYQPITQARTTHLAAAAVKSKVGAAYKTYWNLSTNGDLTATYAVPQDGLYKLAVRAFGQQAGNELCKMALLVDGKAIQTVDVDAEEPSPTVYSVDVMLKAGQHSLGAGFINDFYDKSTGEDRNLVIDWLEFTGPLDAAKKSNPLRDRLVDCDPKTTGAEACATRVLTAFATRAFRRPATSDEVKRFLSFLDLATKNQDDFNTGLKLAMEAVLVSPAFLFRVELDPDPTSKTPHALTDYEVASRLSYFLWSTMPDEALFAAARDGKLHTAADIDKQVVRMLADPRSSALVDNFAGQWLYTRAIDDHVPDYNTFPAYDPALREAMRTETQLFFSEFLYTDLGLDKLLTADFTFVNDRLARHYGLPNVAAGQGFRRIGLGSTERRGLLGQGSLLTVTAYPTRTSPVLRGKWVLEQLLCSPPPPPPPGVEGLPQNIDVGTVRQKLEAHRSDPKCAVCHTQMDPIGFGLEHFDAVGAFRTSDNGSPIDATGVLPGNGGTFDGAVQMSSLVAKDARLMPCVTTQLFTYALGRGTNYHDTPTLDAATQKFAAQGYHLQDLIRLIATSEAFRSRRGEPTGGEQ